MKKSQQVLLFLGIVVLGASLRLYGLNWDQGQHLHPDERFLTQVTNDTKWPSSIAEYFDTETSPLNPHNKGYSFFVYGTFPIFFVKFVAELLGKANYTDITLVGRALSAIIDTGTIILVFFIAKKLFSSSHPLSIAPWAALSYALMALPIQLSHFYTTDPYLTFFLTLSLLIILKKPRWHHGIVLGISLGLAATSKISAVYFLPVVGIAYLAHFWKSMVRFPELKKFQFRESNLGTIILIGIFTAIFFYLTLRLGNPYMFASGNLLDVHLNPKILANWKELEGFSDPNTTFPPALQWIHTTPYLFPLLNMMWLGLGIPLSIVTIVGIVYTLFRRKKYPWLFIPLVWAATTFGYQGFQFVKALRYFYPMYPALAIFAGLGIYAIVSRVMHHVRPRALFLIPYSLFVILLLIWPLMFLSVYSRPHTRVTASQWICDRVPAGSTLATEHWDDGLPLGLGATCNSSRYTYMELPLYNSDSEEKWKQIEDKLKTTDYILLTSNRLYGSIVNVSERYPATTKYYESLFTGSLGFEKVAEFTSRPNLPVPGISLCLTPPGFTYGTISQTGECNDTGVTLIDDYADETWTVYDHPKVIFFHNIQQKTLLFSK